MLLPPWWQDGVDLPLVISHYLRAHINNVYLRAVGYITEQEEAAAKGGSRLVRVGGGCIKVELIFDRSLIGAGIANKTKLGKQRPLGWGGGALI